MNRREKRLLAFSRAAHVVSDGWAYMYPSLLFLIALDFRENYFVLGILANIFIASMGVSGVISGILADRLSVRHMFVAFSLICALGCTFVLLSTNDVTLGAALFLLGVGVGLYHPVGLAGITRNIRRRSAALGIHGLAGGIGASLVPVIVVSVGFASDWKISFAVAAVASLVLLPFIPLIRKEFDRPPAGQDTIRPSLRRISAAMLQRRMLALYTSSILRNFAFTGFFTFLTIAIVERTGVDDTQVPGGLGGRPLCHPGDSHRRHGLLHRRQVG